MNKTEATEFSTKQIQRAKAIQQSVRELEAQNTGLWWELGLMCLEVQEQKLWRALKSKNFNVWVKENAPKSRTTITSAMRAVKQLRGHVDSVSELHQISRGSAEVLSRYVDGQNARVVKQWIGEAVKLAPAELRAAIENTLTPLERTEPRKRILLNPTITQYEEIHRAIANYARAEGSDCTREKALEHICADFNAGVEIPG